MKIVQSFPSKLLVQIDKGRIFFRYTSSRNQGARILKSSFSDIDTERATMHKWVHSITFSNWFHHFRSVPISSIDFITYFHLAEVIFCGNLQFVSVLSILNYPSSSWVYFAFNANYHVTKVIFCSNLQLMSTFSMINHTLSPSLFIISWFSVSVLPN